MCSVAQRILYRGKFLHAFPYARIPWKHHSNAATSPIHLNPNVSPYLFPISLFRDERHDS